jgi:hypothetical protein
MGAERFVDAAKKYSVILTEAEAAQIVAQWRQDHPAIVQLWLAMQQTVEAIAQGSAGDAAEVGRCLVYRRPGSVQIRLPSGRELIYHEMALVESAHAFRSELAFMGPHPLSRKWTQQRTYGGKLVENITQAVARDVLAEGMLELHARGRHIQGSVHDEVLLEADVVDAEGLLEEPWRCCGRHPLGLRDYRSRPRGSFRPDIAKPDTLDRRGAANGAGDEWLGQKPGVRRVDGVGAHPHPCMMIDEITALPVGDLCAVDSMLIL